MKLFAQIRKVDEEKRLVFGRLAHEIVDKADEVMDYMSSKPYFEKWSADIAKDTDGKSVGNLRAMHGKVAAGKFTQIDFNDAEKAIDVCAKVVDNNEWDKVLEGVYTGFSIGGDYVGAGQVEKMDGRDVKRYTAKPSEGSLVDRPCIPSAKFFEVQKADGSLQKVEFAAPVADEPTIQGTPEQVTELCKLMADGDMALGELLKAIPAFLKDKADAKKKASGKGDDKAADSKDTKAADAPAAKVATPEELKKLEHATLRKNFYSCSELAMLLNSLQNLKSSAAWSAYYEGDKSSIPTRIGAVIALAAQVLKEMIDEELAEAAGSNDSGVVSLELSEKTAGLAKFDGDPLVELLKIGARNSASDKARLGKIHDLSVELGHECAAAAAKADQAGTLAKADAASLQKLVDDAVAPLQKALDGAAAEIKLLKEQPAPARVSLRAVSKADDGVDADAPLAKVEPIVDSRGEKHDAASLIKLAHQSGGAPLALRK